MVNRDSLVFSLVGDRGTGKNTLMTYLGYKDYQAGIKVIANYHLGFPHVYMSYAEIIELPEELRDATILLDEGLVGIGARRSMSAGNIKMLEFITQIRKRHCNLYIAMQKTRQIDVGFREQTNYKIDTFKVSDQVFKYIVRDVKDWDDSTNIVNTFNFDAHEFFKLNLFDTDEIIKFGEETNTDGDNGKTKGTKQKPSKKVEKN